MEICELLPAYYAGSIKTKAERKWIRGIRSTDRGVLLPLKPLAGITEGQNLGALRWSSAILWEEDGKGNQIISMNAQVAQSLSMAISSTVW